MRREKYKARTKELWHARNESSNPYEMSDRSIEVERAINALKSSGSLKDRELKIIQLVLNGKRDVEIGRLFKISPVRIRQIRSKVTAKIKNHILILQRKDDLNFARIEVKERFGIDPKDISFNDLKLLSDSSMPQEIKLKVAETLKKVIAGRKNKPHHI